MKDVRDMTEAEICHMTEADVEKAVQFRFMEEGIPLEAPPIPPEIHQPVVEPDVIGYQVFGHVFADREAAEAIAKLASNSLELEIETNWRDQGPLRESVKCRKYDEHTVTIKRMVSVELKSRYEGQLEAVRAAEKAREDAATRHDKVIGQQRSARAAVMEHVDAVRNLETQREHWRSVIQSYLGMTDGDGRIAERFFTKAYPNVLTSFPELRDLFEAEAVEDRPTL